MPEALTRASTTQALQATRPIYSHIEHSPPPAAYCVKSAAELDVALTDFEVEGPYGFDCEYKALPLPGRTALVQLSSATKILLIQLLAFAAVPEKLKSILEGPTVKKTGHYTEADGAKLRDDYGILPKSLINLMPLAHQIDPDFLALHPPPRNVTLAQIVLYYLDRTFEGSRPHAASDAYCAYEVYMRLMTLQEQNNSTLDSTKYTINIEPHTSTPSTIPPGKYYLERNNRKLNNFEFDAYTLWYHGYTAAETLKTFVAMFPMQRMRGYFDGKNAIVSFIVAALRKDTSLPFDQTALRAMINADEVSRDMHHAFLADRCPVPVTGPSDSSAASPTEAEPVPITQQKRKRETSTGDSNQERQESDSQDEEPPRERTSEEGAADSTLPTIPAADSDAAKPVKRSRTM